MMWEPITDLPDNWHNLADPSLHSLAQVWEDQRDKLEKTKSYQTFIGKMRRKIAIETGVIEQLYTIDRGITYILIEQGIDVALIPHGATDKPASQVVKLIRDHEAAIDRVFDYVGDQRDLSTSFVKQLHQLLTRNQDTSEAIDQFGKTFDATLLKGDWKKNPNNPLRPDGNMHYYAPPEQVPSQMDQLVAWHLQHMATGVSPEVEAAWLHHRFTQIHPFQDGNGRVARNLATLVFLRAGWFPLVITNDIEQQGKSRSDYINALESADEDNLEPLVNLFIKAQRQAFVETLSLSQDVLSERVSYQTALDSVISKIQKKQSIRLEEAIVQVENYAHELHKTVLKRLNEVNRDLTIAFRRIEEASFAYVRDAESGDNRDGFYYQQIIEIAKIHRYWANMSGYKSWVRLAVRIGSIQTEILFSFHGLGQENTGVMICTASGWRRLPSEDDETTVTRDIEPLSTDPFDFTYQEDAEQLNSRFQDWLDGVIVLGMEYLRTGI